jgi:hypothetical protein
MFQVLIEAVFHIINFILCWGMNIQNNNMKPVTSQYYVSLPLANSTLLTAHMIILCTKKNPVPNSWFSFPFP